VSKLLLPYSGWGILFRVVSLGVLSGAALPAAAQESVLTEEPGAATPDKVDVVPAAADAQIRDRLSRIINSTRWFESSDVAVRDGVVFLSGSTETQEHRNWAGELASKTEGVVAVVNNIEVQADAGSTFKFAQDEIKRLAKAAARTWPLVLLTLLIIGLAWLLSSLVGLVVRWALAEKIKSPLLLTVVVRLLAVPIFLLGLYFVLQVAGLTRLALTVLGGTGLAGIILGFAFRDIAENFLASLLLSIRNPFRRGDLIQVAGHEGVVQSLNTRSTVLLTLDGNHVQIPNATVYKSTIVNFSANDRRRAQFAIGIGYDSPVAKAQAIIMRVVREHSAVLAEPEPLVLVHELGSATVNLNVSYWFDSATYAPDKINSALLRICKHDLLTAGIELPDPLREVVFPKGVPIIERGAAPRKDGVGRKQSDREGSEEGREVTASEGRLAKSTLNEEPPDIPEAEEDLLKR
jgi:small conductance mechanosensitive channel